MYIMFIKVFGMKLRVECIVICVAIGMLLGSHLLCGCVTDEGMDTIGSTLDYAMNKGIHSDKYEKRSDMREVSGGSLNPSVPLPEGQLFMYANNEFDGKCCSFSNVSGGGGCACITKEQSCYLNARGGNRAAGSEF